MPGKDYLRLQKSIWMLMGSGLKTQILQWILPI